MTPWPTSSSRAVEPHSTRNPAVGLAGWGAAVLQPSTVTRRRSPRACAHGAMLGRRRVATGAARRRTPPLSARVTAVRMRDMLVGRPILRVARDRSRSSAGSIRPPSSASRRGCAHGGSAAARSSSTWAIRATPCSSSSAATSRSRCRPRPATRPSSPPSVRATSSASWPCSMVRRGRRARPPSTATETVVLPRDRFRELIATEAGVRDALLASIAGELRRLTTHVEELHFLDITGRLAARLVRLAQEGGSANPDGRHPAAGEPDPGAISRRWSGARARA